MSEEPAESQKPKGASVFHGYFYNLDPKESVFVKLDLTDAQKKIFQTMIAQPLAELSEEKYWHSFGRFLMTHAPKGYVAWEGKTYWIVRLPKVGADHKYIKSIQCVHLFEFTPEKMRYACFELKDQPNDEEEQTSPDKLCYAAWDWYLDGDGREKQKPLSKAELEILGKNMDWTNDLHKRMQKKFPPDNEWKD